MGRLKKFTRELALMAACLVFGASIHYAVAQYSLVPQLGSFGQIPFLAGNTTAGAGTLTVSAYQMVGVLVSTPTTAQAMTTDTATNFCTLWPIIASQNQQQFNWDLYIKNTSGGANTITVTAGAGVTISGTATIAQNNFRHFKMILSGCGTGQTPALTMLALDSGAF